MQLNCRSKEERLKYIDVKAAICRELKRHPRGLTWKVLKNNLALPYKKLCPEWTLQLEVDIGLVRASGPGGSYVWTVPEWGEK